MIPKAESEAVEFKENLQERKILETICAFLNSKGGKIYVGIKDSGEIVGIDVGKKTIEDLSNRIMKSISPRPNISIDVLKVDDKNVIVIDVPEGNRKPYFYNGRALKRVGKTNQYMDSYEIESLIIKRVRIHWDEVLTDFSLEDIDEKTLRWFVDKIGKEWAGKEIILKKLNLIRGNKLTRAAVLLFGKNPSIHFPQNYIKFMKINELGEVEVMEDISGNLFEMFRMTVELLKKHLPKKIVIEEFERKEKYIIPLEVVREAVLNAIIHREYSLMSFIYVKIDEKEKKVEIRNPGGLPEPLKIDDLYREHMSIPRNPLIANVFKLAGYIEEWGSGTLKMTRLMIKNRLKPPEFVDEGYFFKVILSYESLRLTDVDRKILEFIEERGFVSSSDVAKKFGISSRTARRILKKLETLGLIKSKGKTKGKIYISLK